MKKFMLFVASAVIFASTVSGQSKNNGNNEKKKFKAPKPTIVSDPDFVPRWVPSGEADGKTLGADGKPLADHKIYANDSYYFEERVKLGMKKLIPKSERAKIDEIISVYSTKNKEKQAEGIKEYKTRWKKSPQKEKYYALARLIVMLTQAKYNYDAGEADINYKERIRIKDRIDLDNPPNEAGSESRFNMKKAIIGMYKARKAILKRYPKIYDAGKEIMMKEMISKKAAMKFATINKDKAQMFTYGSFKRTPMAAGLEAADKGETLMKAKPIFLPKGEKVQILKSQSVKAPSGKTMEVCNIKLKSSNMVQHNGRKLPDMTLTGWILTKELTPAK